MSTRLASADLEAVKAIVGIEHAATGAADDAVGGRRPRLVVAPADEAEVAAVLREAGGHGLAVTVRGSGSKLSWGAAPERCDVVLSTRRLNALVEHEPGDLVCVAGAGMLLTDLQARVAAADGYDQRLMLDPPQEGTLGGIVAADASGPLRTRYGTARDLVIGARFVLADGTVGTSGGKVVKNVAGYDIAKLLTGSLGTLAVITQVALRLHPVAPTSRTVVIEEGAAARVQALCARIHQLPVEPSTFDIAWPEGLVLLRIDSSEAGAQRQAELVAEATGGRIVSGDEAVAFQERLRGRPWRTATRAGPAASDAVAALAVPRARLGELLRDAAGYVDDMVVRAPLGTGEARCAAEPARVQALRALTERLGGRLVLRRAPTAVQSLVWSHPDGVAAELMGSVKRALDPGRVLAPGCFVGGI
ncbi:MAG: FAD-binding oxidoreductase [Candidatus Dormibacteria bacterium]